MDRGAWWAIIHGVARVRHNLTTKSLPSCYFDNYSLKSDRVVLPALYFLISFLKTTLATQGLLWFHMNY